MTGYYCPFSRWSHNHFVYLRASSKSHKGKLCSSPKRSFVKPTMTCNLISWHTCSVFMVKEPRRVERSELCKTYRPPKSKHIKEKWSDHEVKYEMLNSINAETPESLKPGEKPLGFCGLILDREALITLCHMLLHSVLLLVIKYCICCCVRWFLVPNQLNSGNLQQYFHMCSAS